MCPEAVQTALWHFYTVLPASHNQNTHMLAVYLLSENPARRNSECDPNAVVVVSVVVSRGRGGVGGAGCMPETYSTQSSQQ